jgi:AcrR family transcriptional regulator
MSRIVKEPEIRFAELLDASEKLFLEQGYVQTTVSDIVKSINVAQGTFYYYFKSKEDVLDAVIERIMTRDVADISGYLARSKKTPLEKLVYVFDTSISTAQERTEKFLYGADGRSSLGIITIDRQKRHAYKLLIPLYENIIKEGIRQGVYQTNVPEEAALFIMGMFDSLVYDEAGLASSAVIAARKNIVQELIECLLGMNAGTLTI